MFGAHLVMVAQVNLILINGYAPICSGGGGLPPCKRAIGSLGPIYTQEIEFSRFIKINRPYARSHQILSPGFFFLFTDAIVLHPSRIRHNRDNGADVQQGPVQRFLFRLRPCVNLFYCLLLAHTLLVLEIIKRDTSVIGKLMIRRSKIGVTRASTNVFLGSMLSPQALFGHAGLMHVP